MGDRLPRVPRDGLPVAGWSGGAGTAAGSHTAPAAPGPRRAPLCLPDVTPPYVRMAEQGVLAGRGGGRHRPGAWVGLLHACGIGVPAPGTPASARQEAGPVGRR